MIIADTNNSLIRSYDPRTQRLTTLALAGVPPPRRSPDGPPAGGAGGGSLEPPLGAALVRAPGSVSDAAGEVRLTIRLPKGYHLTPGANSRFEATAPGAADVQLQPAAGSLAENAAGNAAIATVRFRRSPGSGGSGLVRVVAKVYFCPVAEKDGAVCLFEEVCFDVPLGPAEDAFPGEAPAVVELGYSLSASAPVVSLPGL